MTEIGKINKLRVKKRVDYGVFLDGKEKGAILLPNNSVPGGTKEGDELEVFIYNDSADKLIATTDIPYIMVGEFALLRTAIVNEHGAFMDWGLAKNLIVPFNEQKKKIEMDRSYIVYAYLDEESQRVAASVKVTKFLNNTPPQYVADQEVDLIIYRKTEQGYSAIINNSHIGILYENEVFQRLDVGQKIKAFIKKIRVDEKIDLSLAKPGYEQIDSLAQNVLQIIQENNNFISVTDKSKPEIIYDIFNISKKNFKKAIGNLYRNKFIVIEETGIRFVESKDVDKDNLN